MFSFQAYIIVFSLLICYSLSLYNIKFRFNRLIKPNDIYNRKIHSHSHDNQQTYDAAVIGSGIGGLITAIKLSQKGLKTVLLEKQEFLGGRCGSSYVHLNKPHMNNSFDSNQYKGSSFINDTTMNNLNIYQDHISKNVNDNSSYRFDVGPSLLLLPDVYRSTFESLGENMDDFIELLPVDPFYRCFFEEDSSYIDITKDMNQMKLQLDKIDPNSWDNFKLYMSTAKGFLDFGLPGMFEFLKACLVCLPFLPHSYLLEKLFPNNNKIQSILSFQDLYVGLSPYNAPAVFSLLQALEFDRSIYYPKYGFNSLIKSLEILCRKQKNLDIITGVQVINMDNNLSNNYQINFEICNSSTSRIDNQLSIDSYNNVKRIGYYNDQNRSNAMNRNRFVSSHRVVVNMDAPAAETTILATINSGTDTNINDNNDNGRDKNNKNNYVNKDDKYNEIDNNAFDKVPSCGILSMNLIFDTILEPLTHHSIFVSKYYKESWKVVEDSKDNNIGFNSTAFNFYVHAPSCTDSTVCPIGHDAITILIPVHTLPKTYSNMNLIQSNDLYNISMIRKAVLNRLKSIQGMPNNLEDHIIHEHYNNPIKWNKDYNLYRGAAFGLSHSLNQLAFFRPSIRHPKKPRIYRVGASVRPGNGVPLVMISAGLTSKRIIQDYFNDLIWKKTNS